MERNLSEIYVSSQKKKEKKKVETFQVSISWDQGMGRSSSIMREHSGMVHEDEAQKL